MLWPSSAFNCVCCLHFLSCLLVASVVPMWDCRYAELKRSQVEEELAQCTFSPKINESSKRLAHSARRPATARGRPASKAESTHAPKVSVTTVTVNAVPSSGQEGSILCIGMIVTQLSQLCCWHAHQHVLPTITTHLQLYVLTYTLHCGKLWYQSIIGQTVF